MLTLHRVSWTAFTSLYVGILFKIVSLRSSISLLFSIETLKGEILPRTKHQSLIVVSDILCVFIGMTTDKQERKFFFFVKWEIWDIYMIDLISYTTGFVIYLTDKITESHDSDR